MQALPRYVIKDPACEFIPSCYRRVLDADPLIIDPKDNAPSQRRPLRMSYAQSFLKEEVGKMYRGELIIRGNPDIEPFDIVLLTDEATGLHGPIEVESITHLFNQEMGFVSVIVPRASIMMNESATADLIQAFWMGIHNAQGIFNQVSNTVGEGAAVAGAAVGTFRRHRRPVGGHDLRWPRGLDHGSGDPEVRSALDGRPGRLPRQRIDVPHSNLVVGAQEPRFPSLGGAFSRFAIRCETAYAKAGRHRSGSGLV